MDCTGFREAQMAISRAWRKHAARAHWNKGEVLVRIEVAGQTTAPVICGSFTRPKWSVRVPLRYSLRHHSYILEAWMTPADLFQLEVNKAPIALPHFLASSYHRAKGLPCQIPAHTVCQYKRFAAFYWRKTSKEPALVFCAAASLIPRDGKLLEDAQFLDSNLLGVADGVGGWRGVGVDSGLFASELIQSCKAQALSCWSLSLAVTSDSCTEDDFSTTYTYLVPLAESALKEVKACGSSTLLLCALVGSRLEVLNLGDSKAVLIRFEGNRASVVMRTFPMQHAFNCPYQLSRTMSEDDQREFLSRCDDSQKETMKKALRRLINDGVGRAQIYAVGAKDGDLLIIGSDGLWDNLYEREVLELVACSASAEDTARRLTYSAYLKSRGSGRTPFEDEAVATFGQCAWKGGKQDDITVVAAWVRRDRGDGVP